MATVRGNEEHGKVQARASRQRLRRLLALLAALALVLGAGAALADDDDDDDDGPRREQVCTKTARLQLGACQAEWKDDYLSAQAICLQVPDKAERRECNREARAERSDFRSLCRAQRAARGDLCELLGEGRYVPDFEPEDFETDYRNPSHPNPYYPLIIGQIWEFAAEDETNRIEVLDEIKNVDGVPCIVVNDRVEKQEGGGEDTDDWYALRTDDGTVAYCGESVQDFEVFEGDVPMLPELIAIDGSFKAGRDGDLAGTLFPGAPRVGDAYRQEWSAGNAEDAAIVVSTTYRYGDEPELDAFVPQALAERFCSAGDCVVTGEVTPIEPDVSDLKYYARGVGLFLEVKPEDGEVNQLVGCNFDARCTGLPMP